MKTRTLNELYTLLLKERERNGRTGGFICNDIGFLLDYGKITAKEYSNLMAHFQRNKPSRKKHKEFLLSTEWVGTKAWWVSFTSKQRTLFLEKMIRITKR